MKPWMVVLVVVSLLGLVAFTFMFTDNKPKIVAQPIPKNLPIPVAGGSGAEGNRDLEESNATPERSDSGEYLIPNDDFQKLRFELDGGTESFPAVVNPVARGASDGAVKIGDDELVIGVTGNQSARAYPAANLAHPEQSVVNDILDERPIAVTWNQRNRTALVILSRQAETDLVFEPTARRWRSDLLLRDKSTESYWSQSLGTCVSGQLKGTQLMAIPSVVTTWGEWKKAYPLTTVACFDKRIDETDQVTGRHVASNIDRNRVFVIMSQGNHHLLKFDEIFEERVSHTKLGDFDIVAFYDDKADSVHAYHSIIANQPARFEWRGLLYVVANTETIWNIVSGQAVEEGAYQKPMSRMFVLETTEELWDLTRGKPSVSE